MLLQLHENSSEANKHNGLQFLAKEGALDTDSLGGCEEADPLPRDDRGKLENWEMWQTGKGEGDRRR